MAQSVVVPWAPLFEVEQWILVLIDRAARKATWPVPPKRNGVPTFLGLWMGVTKNNG
jgi:hypothetical protein